MTDNEMMGVLKCLDTYLGHDASLARTKFSIIVRLELLMQEDIVHFVFRKMDGTERHAYGTRSPSLIGSFLDGKDPSRKKPAEGSFKTFPYFDIERHDWRCFRIDMIERIIEDYTI